MTSINFAYEQGRTVDSIQGLEEQEIDVARRKLRLLLEDSWKESETASNNIQQCDQYLDDLWKYCTALVEILLSEQSKVQEEVQVQIDQEDARLRDQLRQVDNMPMGFIANRDIQRNRMHEMPRKDLQDLIRGHPNVPLLIDMFVNRHVEGAELEVSNGLSIDQCIQINNQMSTTADLTSGKRYELINNTELIDKIKRIASQMWLFVVDNSGGLQQTIISYPDTTRLLYLRNRLHLTLQHFFPQTPTSPSPKFMENLVVLHVAGCKHYSMAKIMIPLSQHCPNLETIDVSETTIKHISHSKASNTLVITFPCLKTLVANSCYDLQSIHIQSGVPFTILANESKRLCHINCTPTLTSLSLKDMSIPESLIRLISAPKSQITTLGLNTCGVTDTHLEYLRDNKSITKLSLLSRPGIPSVNQSGKLNPEVDPDSVATYIVELINLIRPLEVKGIITDPKSMLIATPVDRDAIAQSISLNTTLTILDMSRNRLSNQGALELSKCKSITSPLWNQSKQRQTYNATISLSPTTNYIYFTSPAEASY
eukprot:gene7357-8570_t